MPLTSAERQGIIVKALHDSGFMRIVDIATLLNVSDMTIRRDGKLLEQRGLAQHVHGGLMLPSATSQVFGFSARAQEDSESKRAVGRLASSMVWQQGTVIIDSGTTCYAVARALDVGFSGTVITNSIPVLQLSTRLSEATVICLGGQLVADSQAVIGHRAVHNLSSLHANIAFIGASGVTSTGIFIKRDIERAVKRKMIAHADRAVVVLTESKINRSDAVLLATLAEVDELITPTDVPPAIARVAEEHGLVLRHARDGEWRDAATGGDAAADGLEE